MPLFEGCSEYMVAIFICICAQFYSNSNAAGGFLLRIQIY